MDISLKEKSFRQKGMVINMKINIPLSPSAVYVINTLEEAGYSAYAVGGYVRDCLLGLTPSDCDIATSARPEQTLEVFKNLNCFSTGLKHGTVTVLADGEPIEITTFRTDSTYSDGRHPDTVSFTASIDSDILRRDLTINALAYNPKTGITDIVGGISDIQNGIIRSVGDPELRFSEDGLRILRALRFSSVYGFRIEENTASAALKCAYMLDSLSAERIFSELKKLLCGKNAEEVLLSYPEVVCRVIPELSQSVGFAQHNPHHIYDVYTHTAKTVSGVPRDPVLRLAALLHDIGKPATFSIIDGVGHFYGHSDESLRLAEKILDRMKSDKKTKTEVLTLIKYHDPVIAPEEKCVRRYLNRLGGEMLRKLLQLKQADNLAQAPECAARLIGYDKILEIIKDIEAKDACFSLKQLKINGDMLLSLGVKQGKDIGKILNILLEKVISGEIENHTDSLTEEAKKHITQSPDNI